MSGRARSPQGRASSPEHDAAQRQDAAPAHLSNPDSASPREAAAWWFARVHSGRMDDAGRAELARWRQADPAHEREFQAMASLGEAAAGLPRDRVRELFGGEIPVRPALRRRRLAHAGLALAACTAAAAAGVGLWRLQAPQAVYGIRLATRRGERSRHALPDGSTLELNTGTAAEVALYEDRRVVALLQGEIMFAVSADAARPFIVEAGAGRVRVVGTRFSVRRDGQAVAVAVESGTVELSSGRWWRRSAQLLTAGMGAGLAADGGQTAARPVDVAALTAWRDGRLVFKDAPLAEVVREVNRYLAQPLRVGDGRLNALRVTASFRLDTPEALLASLPHVLPVEVRRLPDGAAALVAR